MTGSSERDERIAAYLDGAMSEAEAAAFEQALADDPALAADLECMAGNDSLLREAFAEPAVDQAFIARMGLVEPGSSAAPTPLAANDNPPFWRRWSLPAGGAIAAGLALVLSLTLQQNSGTPGLSEALDATPSGQLASLEDGKSVTPMLSFAAGDGRFCREFAYRSSSGERGGIACRGSSGWQIEAWGEGAAQLPDPGEIALASGAGEGSLDEAYARLKAGDPLLAEQEKALIERGWQAD